MILPPACPSPTHQRIARSPHHFASTPTLQQLYRAGWTGGYKALLGSLSFSDPPKPANTNSPRHLTPCTPSQSPSHLSPPQLYRAGWTGGYEALLGSLSFSDWRHHEWNRAVRPRLAALGLARRWQPQWDGPS